MTHRPARIVLGTVLVAIAGFGLWLLQRTAPTESPLPVVTPNSAAAQIITPGAVVRPAQPARTTPAVAPAKSRPSDETWQVIYFDDQRVGWSRTLVQTLKRDSRPIVRTTAEVTMQFRRFGQKVDMQKSLVTEETPGGDLLSYTMELRNPPAAPNVTRGVVEGTQLRVETTVGGRTQTTRVHWDPEVRAPAWQERLFRSPLMKPGEKREYKSFYPDFNKVATVKVAAEQMQTVKLLDGTSRSLLRVRSTNSAVPDLASRTYLDESGIPLRMDEDLLGKPMVTYTVSREEALRKLAGADLDLAVSTLVPTQQIRNPYSTMKVTYRISMSGDDPEKYFEAGPTQRVQRTAGDTIELTVTAPEKAAVSGKPTTVAEEFTRPTQYLQSNDALVQEHARKAVSGTVRDDARAAVLIEQYVHRNLNRKNFSTALASAAEVAVSLEGDCTEHAVLTAAMLRNRGIPSRIVVGLVYVEGVQAFGAHMWAEAWIGGRWFPLDATLGRGGIAATHLRIGDSSLAEENASPVSVFLPLLRILGNVKIEVVHQQ